MTLPKRYNPAEAEPRIAQFWHDAGIYHFDLSSDAPIYSIDTPPPTVSGYLHLGHVYSYSEPDFIARFRRMRGDNVYYPMGYDDNGLPTERLVEKQTGKTAEEMGREAFIRTCLEMTVEFEREYQALWQRLGLSVDWRYTYRTIDDNSRATSQLTFLDLLRKGLAYRREAPTIWCPHCHTAIAQAEVNDLERQSEFVTLPFTLENGETLPIATTRPELLPACVAVFVHPQDERYRGLVGQTARVPLFGLEVPLMADEHADPEKGTGAVMCCTFGDQVDVEWWLTHHLPLRVGLDRGGRLTGIAGQYAGLPVPEARREIIGALETDSQILGRQPVEQTVRVHERCDTPVEYIVTNQWCIRVLDHKDVFLQAGEKVEWYPASMRTRYREWVENLHWDWFISRQRYYGVPFPVWYCSCGTILTADESQLPVDPITQPPPRSCDCGSQTYAADEDVMDTWATSSCSPQIAGRMRDEPELYARVFPMSLRPQAHEIIRTWAFDTIVMSHYRFDAVPWSNVLISGWGLAAAGTEKISKSRGGGPMAPMEMLELYSADAARYWAASTGPGKDAVISEEKIGAGAKLVTKLWNVATFSGRFLAGYDPMSARPRLSPADRWILSALQSLIRQATASFESYEYAGAKSATETFFWNVLADNYLEMAKKRLYDAENPGHEAARYTLHAVLPAVLKLFAPFLPYVTEEIYRGLFQPDEERASIHRSSWPDVDEALVWQDADAAGKALVEIAEVVRRYKSSRQMSLGAELGILYIQVQASDLLEALRGAEDDVASVSRAREVRMGGNAASGLEWVDASGVGTSSVTVSIGE